MLKDEATSLLVGCSYFVLLKMVEIGDMKVGKHDIEYILVWHCLLLTLDFLLNMLLVFLVLVFHKWVDLDTCILLLYMLDELFNYMTLISHKLYRLLFLFYGSF